MRAWSPFPQGTFTGWCLSRLGSSRNRHPASRNEYANAALARERLFQYFSEKNGTPVVLIRLNYAVELRYGVLVDIATKVWSGEPVDVATGH